MPTMKFTARSIEALKPGPQVQIDYWDDSLPGFGIRVTSSRRKTWFVFYRFQRRKRRLSLGTFPTLTLADAREVARDALYKVATGIDPARAKADEKDAESFLYLATEYLERHAKPNKRSWKEDSRMINKDLVPAWGNVRAKDITRKDVLNLLDGIVNRGAPVHANRMLTLVRKVFNFGIEREIVVMNPCYVVRPPTKEISRQRVLTAGEIRSVWTAIEEQSDLIGSIFRLYLFTGQRGVEIRSMEWTDIDLESRWWTIPAEKAKNGLSHRVPLNDGACAILTNLKSAGFATTWVFPSPIDSSKHIDNIQKALQRIRKAAMVDFVAHDLRRTVASHMAGMGVPRIVISKVLNHVDGGVTRIYDRHSYDGEKVEALTRWGKRLEAILENQDFRPDLRAVEGVHATVGSVW